MASTAFRTSQKSKKKRSIMHSSEYRKADDLADKWVMMVGLGERASDIALEIAP